MLRTGSLVTEMFALAMPGIRALYLSVPQITRPFSGRIAGHQFGILGSPGEWGMFRHSRADARNHRSGHHTAKIHSRLSKKQVFHGKLGAKSSRFFGNLGAKLRQSRGIYSCSSPVWNQ